MCTYGGQNILHERIDFKLKNERVAIKVKSMDESIVQCCLYHPHQKRVHTDELKNE